MVQDAFVAHRGRNHLQARNPINGNRGAKLNFSQATSYNLVDDATMEVINRCDRANGDEQGVIGEAEVVDGNFNTFSVEFGDDTDTPGINYVVAAVGDEEAGQYRWAAVYSPDGNTGWILAREPELAEEDRQEAEASLRETGVDLSELSDTTQPPQTYNPVAE